MWKRKDWLVIAFALTLALLLYAGIRLYEGGRGAAKRVDVYVNGLLWQSAPLRAGETLRVSQENGSVNVIRLTENGFYMESSTCKNQLCVKQSAVTVENFQNRSLGAHILCLPNRVDARLAGVDETLAPDA